MSKPYRVVKLGGSLFDHGALVPDLRRWLAQQSPARHVLVPGGGDLAETFRRLDALHGLGEVAAHWLCVRAMQLNAHLATALWPEAALASGLAALRSAEFPPLVVFDVWTFLRQEEPTLTGRSLPHGWHVTSDSIAARLAEVLGVDLVLLKSSLPQARAVRAASDEGYVDRYFADAAAPLSSVRCVNLRAHDFPETWLETRRD